MADEGRFNTFSNDGSFLERFKKLQEEKQKQEPSGEVSAAAPLLKKSKPIVMKLSAVKKRPLVVRSKGKTEKTFSQGTLSESDEEEDIKTEHGIPLAKSIGLATNMATPDASRLSGDSGQASGPMPSSTQLPGKKRKRNRWSDAPPTAVSLPHKSGLSEDEKAIASAMASFSEDPSPSSAQTATGQSLTPAQLKQMQEQIEMNKLVTRIRAVTQASTSKKRKRDPNNPQYEYDSDEEVEGGTWEHKKRTQEMMATYNKALQLTEQGMGKHHIGDFLPPEELDKFLEKIQAIKEGRDPDFSDYKEHKLDESNVGFRMLRNAGWSEGKGLGEKGDGIVNPINKGKGTFNQAGVGAEVPAEVTKDDSTFDSYRKRMMLAYRFRPNPMNNPRRPYY